MGENVRIEVYYQKILSLNMIRNGRMEAFGGGRDLGSDWANIQSH